MNTLTTQKILFSAVLEDLDDMTARHALADFYEEQGKPDRSSCWRWLAGHRSRPSEVTFPADHPMYPNTIQYFWNHESYDYRRDDEVHLSRSYLPQAWLDFLVGDRRTHNANKAFLSKRNAFLEVVRCWCIFLTEEDREGIRLWRI